MNTPGDIAIDVNDGVAILRLRNPARRNAVSVEMWRAIAEFASQVGTRADVRLVAIRGDGDVAFSANADGGFPEIVVLAGDTARLVFAGDQPLADGAFLFSIPQIDFRDDRRLFFLAFDLLDRVNLYVAEPLF